MKLWIILILFAGPLVASQQLLPESGIHKLDSTVLADYSKNFLRYARNEIFARHGYIFKDQNLKIYFEHQDWYESKGNTISLNPTEKANIELILSIENKADSLKHIITFKEKFNGGIILCVASGNLINFRNSTKKRYSYNGQLCYIEGHDWILQCSTLPLEYLVREARSIVNFYDSGSLPHARRFRIENIDADSKFDSGDELRAIKIGPSDDPEIIYYGIDDNKNLVELIHIRSDAIDISKLTDEKLLITATIRMNLAGTSFFPQEYIYDSTTRTCKKLPQLFLTPDWPIELECKQPIAVYYDPRSAALGESIAIIDTLNPSVKFKIVKYYRADRDGSASINYGDKNFMKKGWISQRDINWQKVDGLSGAD